MRITGTQAIGLIVGISFGLGAATSAPAQGVTTAPTAVEQCLCAQRAVSILGRQMRESQRRDRRMHADLDALSREVDTARGRVNTENRSDIEAFTALLERHDAAVRSVQAEDQRDAALVARYNRAVQANNAACTGRLFDPQEVDAVKATLMCPRP